MSGLDVDLVQTRRVSTRLAARYLGCTPRHVVALIHAGDLPGSIDIRVSGAKRAAWVVPVHAVRALILRREMRDGKKIAE